MKPKTKFDPDEFMRLKSAWNAARNVTFFEFIRFFDGRSGGRTPEEIERIDRIFGMIDVNGLIAERLAAMKAGNRDEALRIRRLLEEAGIVLKDGGSSGEGTQTTSWELAKDG